jgi:hypothetical protein
MKSVFFSLLFLVFPHLPVHAAFVCEIDPPVSTNAAGDIHFFSVYVTQNGFPMSFVNVQFIVTSGPNSGETNSAETDFNGEAVFFYFSDGRNGKDTIVATTSLGTTCTATKVWVDYLNEPPVAFCRNVVTNAGWQCSVAVPPQAVDDGSFDYDGNIARRTLTPPGPYPVGVTPVTLTVTDDEGASDSCTATITVVDRTPPAVLCPIQVVTNVPAGKTSAIVPFDLPAALDNCGTATVVCDPPSGSEFPVGLTPVVCTGTDSAGNTNECVFPVIVVEEPEPGHDLMIAKLKAPKAIKLSATVTQQTAVAAVTLVNLGDHPETIESYENLVALVVQSLGGGCLDPLVTLLPGAPNKPLPVILAPRKKLNVYFSVTIGCANNPLKGIGQQDYRVLATVNHAALDAGPDSQPANNDCPRPPNPAMGDKGCGGKGGAAVLIDVTVK